MTPWTPPTPTPPIVALLVAWLIIGAFFAAWLAVRLDRRRPLDARDHAAGIFLMLLGPLAAFGVAYDITVYGLRRRRVRS